MTAFLRFLADLTVADWTLLLVAWVIIAVALGAFTGLAIKRADEAESRQRADITRRAAYPPPVPRPTTPPFTQTVASADWFWGIPAECLSDDAIRALADDMDAHFTVIEGTDQ